MLNIPGTKRPWPHASALRATCRHLDSNEAAVSGDIFIYTSQSLLIFVPAPAIALLLLSSSSGEWDIRPFHTLTCWRTRARAAGAEMFRARPLFVFLSRRSDRVTVSFVTTNSRTVTKQKACSRHSQTPVMSRTLQLSGIERHCLIDIHLVMYPRIPTGQAQVTHRFASFDRIGPSWQGQLQTSKRKKF